MAAVRKVSIPLGAGLWKSMFATIEDGKIKELATTREELEEKEAASERS